MSKEKDDLKKTARAVVSPEKLAGGGESQGGAFPDASPAEDEQGVGRHGGQSVNAYHGTGQLGDEEVGGGNANAPAKGG